MVEHWSDSVSWLMEASPVFKHKTSSCQWLTEAGSEQGPRVPQCAASRRHQPRQDECADRGHSPSTTSPAHKGDSGRRYGTIFEVEGITTPNHPIFRVIPVGLGEFCNVGTTAPFKGEEATEPSQAIDPTATC